MYIEFAEIYDKVMEYANYNDWYEFLEEIFEEVELVGNDILDLGCGTGEILLRLKQAGYRVLGLDLSADMLGVARQKFEELGEEVALVNQDMRDFKLPVGFDAVVSLFDTINHLTSMEGLDETMKSVYEHLPEGGVFIFDIVTRKLMRDTFKNGVFVDDRDEITILWSHFYDRKTKLDRVHTSFFVGDGVNYKRIDEVHDKKIFSENEVDEIAEKNNFKVEKKFKDGDLAGDRIFYVLRK